jgi:hypothetical protein
MLARLAFLAVLAIGLYIFLAPFVIEFVDGLSKLAAAFGG